MSFLRHLPLKYRLPLIHGALRLLGKLRASGWTRANSGLPPRQGPLVVSGFFNETLGIGRAGRLTAQALKAAGYDVIEHDLRPSFKRILPQSAQLPGQLPGQAEGQLPGVGGVWLIHANAPECLVAFLAHPPQTWAGRYRIGYWAWETPKAPADWVWIADYLHEIWLPSHFTFDAVALAFRRAGRDDLVPRLRLMPHPVLPTAPMRYQDAQTRFGLDPDLTEVLCLFDTKSSGVRKNPWAVLDAWHQAFPAATQKARLTLKVSDLSGDRATEQRLLALVTERPDIRVLSDRLSDAEIDGLIAHSDILVSLHRSEGFGLTLAEAMAAGVAVIATAGSGNGDFMSDANARLIPAGLVPVHDPEGPYTGLDRDRDQVWADPDTAAAARALRELIDDPDKRRTLAAAGRRDIRRLEAPWARDALKVMAFNLSL